MFICICFRIKYYYKGLMFHVFTKDPTERYQGRKYLQVYFLCCLVYSFCRLADLSSWLVYLLCHLVYLFSRLTDFSCCLVFNCCVVWSTCSVTLLICHFICLPVVSSCLIIIVVSSCLLVLSTY